MSEEEQTPAKKAPAKKRATKKAAAPRPDHVHEVTVGGDEGKHSQTIGGDASIDVTVSEGYTARTEGGTVYVVPTADPDTLPRGGG